MRSPLQALRGSPGGAGGVPRQARWSPPMTRAVTGVTGRSEGFWEQCGPWQGVPAGECEPGRPACVVALCSGIGCAVAPWTGCK
jgi:hypothetical protein